MIATRYTVFIQGLGYKTITAKTHLEILLSYPGCQLDIELADCVHFRFPQYFK